MFYTRKYIAAKNKGQLVEYWIVNALVFAIVIVVSFLIFHKR
jgi:hypothetical protein